MDERLPQEIIAEDHRLEAVVESGSAALAQYRWHWTLDETNPKRVSLRQYARDVGRNYGAIHSYAHGYAAKADDHGGVITLPEAIERAKMGAETEAVTEAVANARGQSFGYTRKERASEIRAVREEARERAEQKGTTVEDEAPIIAQALAAQDLAIQDRADESVARRSMRYIEIDSHILTAFRALAKADKLASLSWDEGERELIRHSMIQLRKLMDRIDAKLAGLKPIDWDSELEDILNAQQA